MGKYGQGAVHRESSEGTIPGAGTPTATHTSRPKIKNKGKIGISTVKGTGNDTTGKKLPSARRGKRL